MTPPASSAIAREVVAGLAGDPALVDAIALRVVELLRGDQELALIDAAEVARRFGVTRSWVYEHADELGAIRIGPATARPRLRFDPAAVAAALAASTRTAAPTDPPRAAPRSRRRADTTPGGAPLLPIKHPEAR